ncbi:hypothetical protein [Flavobacterium aquidurense]|uniref:Uncharacterized protein n=1 Tax=Flavobacterium aquidurense TaxID=362413 RepID=A0A0Q0WAD7_9FLAO|nr:hypothetical protein [Flavobacterium aquidurense]KQB41322.1 hypothetical protein RC62_4068 [Flavobacterium aquidurense]
MKVKAKIIKPIIAGITSRKQVNPSFGFIIDAIKEIEKRLSKKYMYFINLVCIDYMQDIKLKDIEIKKAP